jgi:endonuclease YncB( thermonuclease family)
MLLPHFSPSKGLENDNFMKAICLVITTSLAFANHAFADELTILDGIVTKVRDGDTVEVGRIPIRLNGVSAPEMNEPLGPQSKAFMTDLVMGKRVRCELDGSKTHDRFVGICYLNGKDIGATVIAKRLTFFYVGQGARLAPLFYILITYKEDRMPLSH